MKLSRIAIAFSGGGIRALGFHLGVLARLAEENLLEDVAFISSVSGGSLGVALVFALNDWKWPSSQVFRERMIPELCKLLTTKSLQTRLVTSTIFSRKKLMRRSANTLADVLERDWNINASLRDLPDTPRWVINATCHETGKRWRFEKKRIGDQSIGETQFPDFPISRAVAASAAIPFAVGPLEFEAYKFDWQDFDTKDSVKLPFSTLHLWDGALYDNLGLEAFVKIGGTVRSDIFDFLIVSDGSSTMPMQDYNIFKGKRWLRITDILGSQSQSLRSRDVVSRLNAKEFRGAYFKLGNSVQTLLAKGNKNIQLPDNFAPLAEHTIITVGEMGLSLKKLSLKEFDNLLCHGYETASTVLHMHNEDCFPIFLPHNMSTKY